MGINEEILSEGDQYGRNLLVIFVTVGSQKFQFNRLLKAVDELRTDEAVFAQTGYSDYQPQNYKYKDFLDRSEYADAIKKADIVITHGGTGAIIGAVKQGKKVIAVPRLAKYGEHVDDHQIQLVQQFDELNLIYACIDSDLQKALEIVKKTVYQPYQSNTDSIIKNLEEYFGDL